MFSVSKVSNDINLIQTDNVNVVKEGYLEKESKHIKIFPHHIVSVFMLWSTDT